jgi:hypothetical protein
MIQSDFRSQCMRVDAQGSTANCRSAHRRSRCRRGLAHQQDERRMQAFAFTDGANCCFRVPRLHGLALAINALDLGQVLSALRPAAERHGWTQRAADQLALGIGAWTCRGHQLRSPNRVIMAGTRKLRTMNVSNRMPSATPMPTCTIV